MYRMYKGYYANRKENDDEKEFLVKEMKAELGFPGKFFAGSFGKAKEKESVNQRIRREYRRYIKKGFKKKETVPEASTPKELLAMVESRRMKQRIRPEEQEKICRIYERARYGEEECTKEEAEEIKKLLV
ncbi:MAG: DUF4129 domain-containing protein [Lachnospiraceae bacterium]|nr:DUF4129 domain-containing protein [Lachnospiraceae bacterium]